MKRFIRENSQPLALPDLLEQKGSPESKELDQAGTESDREQMVGRHAREDSPRWSKYGDWRTAVGLRPRTRPAKRGTE